VPPVAIDRRCFTGVEDDPPEHAAIVSATISIAAGRRKFTAKTILGSDRPCAFRLKAEATR
jgi:hypothetical protein